MVYSHYLAYEEPERAISYKKSSFLMMISMFAYGSSFAESVACTGAYEGPAW